MRNRAAAVALLCLLLVGCGPTIDEETYEQIATGMTVQQVNDLIGSNGEKEVTGGVEISAAGVMSTTSSEGLREQIYVWKEAGLNKPEIIVTFRDGLMVSKRKRNF